MTSAKDRAYAWVKDRILDGDFPGGGLLSEGEVADALAVSRTPVREAFLLLEAEGLMRLYPRRGALVVAVSPEEVRDLVETRLLVERHAARRAARDQVGRAALVAGLREEIARQQEALAHDDLAAFVAADRDFHHALVASAGNGILTRLSESLRDRRRRMIALTVARDPGLAQRFLDEHRAICDAIAAGDARAAGRLVEAHIEGSREAAGAT